MTYVSIAKNMLKHRSCQDYFTTKVHLVGKSSRSGYVTQYGSNKWLAKHLVSETKRPETTWSVRGNELKNHIIITYKYLAITIVSEPRTFAKIYVCFNGMKGFSLCGDVTTKAARDS